ncbi:MAG: hypothetical protein FWG14_08505 [Peptococcaceae bacterium]|nr:hypothetical protein [Peptococcaceae bacterium]
MNTSSKTVSLIIEIILSTVFFAAICTIVLQLLLQAQKLEQYSRDKSGAVALAQSIGDIFRSQMAGAPQDFDVIMSLCYGEALVKEEDHRYTLYLDERMLPNKPVQPAHPAHPAVPAIGLLASSIEFPAPTEETPPEESPSCFASVTLEDVQNIPAGTMSRVSIQVEKQGTVLFELSVDRYRPGESPNGPNPPDFVHLSLETGPGLFSLFPAINSVRKEC